ncbi:MAG TPA: c-type cytochrome [Gemmatimonadaceae bacterium]|nr:c-type cytochrome [Gemmatimonadaceae bacterium]
MKRPAVIFSLAGLCVVGTSVVVAQQQETAPPPPWAYGFATPPAPASAAPVGGAGQPGRGGGGGRGGTPPAPDTTRRTLAGSDASFTLAQVRDGFGPADWFPGDHPAMPAIVAQGRRDANITACALCHYPNGKGRPENAGVSGLPFAYIMQTMMDFKNDARKSFDTRKTNTGRMIQFAKAMTDDEIKAAATYFSSIKSTPWVKVVETDSVPKTRIAGGMFVTLEGADAGKEVIGPRIIEVPENGEATETLRNPRSGFIAYVPTGSIKKGEALATRGQCAICHGTNLEGLGPVPAIAGRSPSYVVRQLYDMQHGTRTGIWSELMKRVVAPLTTDDMLNLAAYSASRAP